MMKKYKEFFRKAFQNRKVVAGVIILGLIASFSLGHLLSFRDNRRAGIPFSGNGRPFQGQMQNKGYKNQRGYGGQAQNPQAPNTNAQSGQGTQGSPNVNPNQDQADGTSSASVKQ